MNLYYEEAGEGVPILLIPPAGSTASTWGAVLDDLALVGRVIAYDRRGYARSGGKPPYSMCAHTCDAASLLERRAGERAVVVGTSAGAGIAIDLAVRRPDLVRAVVAHEFPWRMTRHLPTRSQLDAFAAIAASVVRRRYDQGADVLLRNAYVYRDGGTAWDAFPEEWRQIGRKNGRAALVDFVNSIRDYPSAMDLARIAVPVVCSFGSRSPAFMAPLVRSLAAAIPGARIQQIEGSGHAAPFDACDAFVALIGDTLNRADKREAVASARP